MTADIIERAAAIIAREHPHWKDAPDDGILSDLRRAVNAECLNAGRRYAQALADAGLLPTEQVWGVRHPDLARVVLTRDADGAPISSKEHAMVAAREGFTHTATVVTRHRTEWNDVTT